ncbi:hypothetical protein [Orbus mooreae]|uniref:hypothetical protein n=1 Tax=Orbus mooreae TaxID=3074107 RepID=UPI00370D0A96
MSASVTIEQKSTTLYLIGILDNHTLERVWLQYSHFSHIDLIDVSALTRVDSSGLALLTYLCLKYDAVLRGATPQLRTLVELYDLEPVVFLNSTNLNNE